MYDMTEFKPHHVAITVRDVASSQAFYSYFGFKMVAKWTARDESLVIIHMAQSGGFVLEMFGYTKNEHLGNQSLEVGNDLEEIGVKHFGFNVSGLPEVRDQMIKDGISGMTEIKHGRTQVDYFFVPDPDGNWVEVVEDLRSISPTSPLVIQED
jgi:catechol 2,3-dioxygenase-like lactoylglutathione lyase family enzyme